MTETQIGRLALRVEGDWWVAYYAMPDTMTGAIELARASMAVVRNHPAKDLFMDFARQVVGDLLEESLGARPEWPSPPHAAPEHERAGTG